MKLEKVVVTTSREFREAMDIYRSSFLQIDRRTTRKFIESTRDPRYDFFVYNSTDQRFDSINGVCGFIGKWDLEDFHYVDYFAIKENLRKMGYGTRMLKEFLNTLYPEGKDDRKLFLEVEKSENVKAAEDRIEFYKRAGFVANPYQYEAESTYTQEHGIKPEYIPFLIMSYPTMLDQHEFEKMKEKVQPII